MTRRRFLVLLGCAPFVRLPTATPYLPVCMEAGEPGASCQAPT